MTVMEYLARQTQRMAESLAHFIGTTPDDKLAWHASIEAGGKTRSILEQVAECIQFNRSIASLLRGHGAAGSSPVPEIHLSSGQEAQEQLVASAMELATAIRGLTEADLTRVYDHPRAKIVGENLLIMCYRNMAYHAGQANYIQTLYGDTEFHVPPTWR